MFRTTDPAGLSILMERPVLFHGIMHCRGPKAAWSAGLDVGIFLHMAHNAYNTLFILVYLYSQQREGGEADFTLKGGLSTAEERTGTGGNADQREESRCTSRIFSTAMVRSPSLVRP